VLVASPRRDTLEEAVFFAEALEEADIAISALIVNRMHPRFAPGLAEAAEERARRWPVPPSATTSPTSPTSS